jgi:hypothetical protein
MDHDLAKRALITVGTGRGFVVEGPREDDYAMSVFPPLEPRLCPGAVSLFHEESVLRWSWRRSHRQRRALRAGVVVALAGNGKGIAR